MINDKLQVTTASDLSLIFRALDFSAKKHRDQRRKDIDATPYINHPIEVAELLINMANISDASVIVAAILHDTVEDTETTQQELESLFGKEVADIVMEVTDDKPLPKAERKRLQIERAAGSSDKAKLVKLADKICNLKDISDHPPEGWTLERKQEYFDWSKQVVDRIRGVNREMERLFDEEYGKRP